MNILSFNIWGMGASHKLEWLKILKKEFNISFCGIQETNMSSLPFSINNRWGDGYMGFTMLNQMVDPKAFCVIGINFFSKTLRLLNLGSLCLLLGIGRVPLVQRYLSTSMLLNPHRTRRFYGTIC